ncbi:acyl-CoA dehydrogenase family protein, partial [Streptomyces alanosinicus]|uniref:acyl-CoA dehydrogenase family protein n=1 Tax=Streptomyces alanosinicus TaxID=68171 RepID=UPI0016748CFE
MRFLRTERTALEELLPGLDATLSDHDWDVLERPGSPAFEAFRKAGGPALLVPSEHAGTGADPVQAVRVQRAVAARSPSLAVATTMHHFSVAGLVETHRANQGLEWMLLEGVARDGLLLASGFAEGRPGRHILSPTMRAERTADGQILVSGAKRPCSLARSMDLLTASVTVPLAEGEGTQMAVALVPAGSDGMRVEPFWTTPVLAGAESEAVVLDRVPVPEDLLVRITPEAAGGLDALQTAGFLWFELLMTVTYLGAASALAERVLLADRASVTEQAALVTELEAVMGAVEGIAFRMAHGFSGQEALAAALVCRYSAQDAIARAVLRCVESLGGMAFIGDPQVAYLASCTQALVGLGQVHSPVACPFDRVAR